MFQFLARLLKKSPSSLPQAHDEASPQQDPILGEIVALEERLGETLQGTLAPIEQAQLVSAKALRRIYMTLDQQGNLLKDLQNALESLNHLTQPPPPPPFQETGLMTRHQVLSLLDAAQNSGFLQGGSFDGGYVEGGDEEIGSSADGVLIGRLLAQLGWEPVARPKEAYHPTACEILEAVASDSFEPGTVLQVIQQGYLDGDGALIRRAKVIVAKSSVEQASVDKPSVAPEMVFTKPFLVEDLDLHNAGIQII